MNKRASSTIENREPPSNNNKKLKLFSEQETKMESGFFRLDEDLLFEVLKHVDAKSLARSSCVSKQWYRTAQDERLWEMICTRHWANIGCGNQQLRSVVLALGGFKKLHSLYLWPLLKQPSSSSSSPFPAPVISPTPNMLTHWGKDEVHLSLSLLSIRYYEKMHLNPYHRLHTAGVVLETPKKLFLEENQVDL